MRKITQKQLTEKENRGAKVKRPEKKIATDVKPPVATTQPTPSDIDLTVLKTTTKATSEAMKNISDSNLRQEKRLEVMLEGLEQVIKSNEKEVHGPIAYDMIIERGRSGLITKIRIEPVVTVH